MSWGSSDGMNWTSSEVGSLTGFAGLGSRPWCKSEPLEQTTQQEMGFPGDGEKNGRYFLDAGVFE